MATKKFDVVANVGEYTNRQGEAKKRYLTIGAVFENDQGHMSLKLECVPLGPDWSGWANLYVPKERDAAPVSEHSAAKANGFVADQDEPF